MYNFADHTPAPPYAEGSGSDGGYTEPPSALLPNIMMPDSPSVNSRVSLAAVIVERFPSPPIPTVQPPVVDLLSPVGEEIPSVPGRSSSSQTDITPSPPTPAPALPGPANIEINAAYETLMDKYEAALDAMQNFAEALDALPVDPELVRRRRRRALVLQPRDSVVGLASSHDEAEVVSSDKPEDTPLMSMGVQATREIRTVKVPLPHVIVILLFVFTVTYKFL